MNIACLSYYLPPVDGIGAGYQMHYIANAYARRGHRVTMFSPYREKADDALYEMVQVPVGTRYRTLRFARNLRQQAFGEFDFIHSGVDDVWLAGKPRPPHIRTFMGSCLAEAFHCKGLKDRFRMLALGLSEWVACGVADRTVCISEGTKRYIPFVRRVIGCGYDPAVFRPGAARSEAPSILFVGEMHSRKRGDLLLTLFREQIRTVLPTAELWIARETEPVSGPGVRWFGRVPLEKLVELYQRAWLFCLPSSYEGFGVPYVEAMACGTPAVATPNRGAMEVLQNGKSGAIYELPALGDRLVELLQDEAERERLKRVGLARAAEFTWDRIIEQYEQLAQGLMPPARETVERGLCTN